MTDQPTLSLPEVRARLQAIEAEIEATLWDSSLGEAAALVKYRQAREALEGLIQSCESAALPACQALLAYALLREDDLAYEVDSDLSASLGRMERAVALAEASGDDVQLGRCLMVQGERLLVAERLDEARNTWDRCEAIGHAGDDMKHRQLLGWLLLMRARQALREFEFERALELAQETRGILETIEDAAGLGALYLVLALLYEAQERPAAEIAIAYAEAGRWTARARAKHQAEPL
jgi:tetratricopeptide (TPR) repeat protein